jgi:phosphocarrier protein FPr
VVGIVVVSHSARLAEGVVELAREMGGEEVRIEAAGGLADPAGAIGTDPVLVMEAIERARGEDGVLVLMDLGSALMSAEMAVELAGEAGPVVLSEAPLVEGAVAAAATARVGGSLEEVAAEARGALAPKAAQLGGGAGGGADAGAAAGAADAGAGDAPTGGDGEGLTLRLTVHNRLGLHARPAARLVGTAGRFDAVVSVVNETTGAGPASARSLTALATLGVLQGHDVVVHAQGPQAQDALGAIQSLAAEGFGDDDGAGQATEAATAGSPEAGAAATGTAVGGEPGGTPVQTAPDAVDSAGPGTPEAGAAAEPGTPEAIAPPEPGTRLEGIAASPGIVLGEARRLRPPELEIPDEAAGDADSEWRSLDEARAAARREIERARDDVGARASASEAAIFDAHLLLLDDEALLDPARRGVSEEGRSAARAWQSAAGDAARAFEALGDEYLRARAADVRDVAARVLGHVLGVPAQPTLTDPGIVIAAELTPGETAALDRDLVLGIATARGTATSHAAILARALGIPAVVGAGDALLGVADATPLVLDGQAGDVLVDPPADEREAYERRRAAAEERRTAARARATEPAVTRDGAMIRVEANLGSPDEVADALAEGAEGVGLLRTEFLFGDRERLPDEEEQLAVYREIAAALRGRPLVVRTLDAGADKPLPALPQPAEANPFLGRRGIRLALAEPEVLRVQLRALVRAAAEQPAIKVLLPMVSTLEELRTARAMLEESRRELAARAGAGGATAAADEQRRAVGMAHTPEVGVMVEVPATAIAADRFAPEVDFFSIGTNDLAQYTMAAERGNERVAALADGPVPAVLRLVAQVTAAARPAGRPVAVCGELAGDPEAAVLLTGLGVRELSMAPSRIPEVKEALRGVELAAAQQAAREALDRDTADEARELAAALLSR